MLSSGGTLDFNFYIFAFFSALYADNLLGRTLPAIFKVICWSLESLWTGTWPSADHLGKAYVPGTVEHRRAGTPLAGGHFCVLMSVKGDLVYLAKVLKLPWYSSSKPCAMCSCDTSTTPWSDFRPCAEWRRKVWGNSEWAAEHPTAHPIFRGGFSCGIQSVAVDIMHCKHLGTDQWFYGSVLYWLCYHVMPKSPEENLQDAWSLMVKELQACAGSRGICPGPFRVYPCVCVCLSAGCGEFGWICLGVPEEESRVA